MNIFRGFLSVVIAFVLFAVSFGQDCPNGQCARPARPALQSIVQGPVIVVQSSGAVVRKVATAPRRLIKQRPIRQWLSRFGCR